MGDEREEPLDGGAPTGGIVRIGDTVRVPPHPRSEFVEALLRHLDVAGFEGAPRALGRDQQGRHVLSFVAGDIRHASPYGLSDRQLLSAIDLIRRFHDATEGSSLCADQEVVCHGDLGPHNMIFRGQDAVAIIDWDQDVAPGRRAVDFAHAVWCLGDLIEPTVPVAEQARRVALMCGAYPGMSSQVVVTELTARFIRARNQHESAGRARAVDIFDQFIAWMQRHGPELADPPAPR